MVPVVSRWFMSGIVILAALFLVSPVWALTDDLSNSGGPPSTFLSWDSLFNKRPSRPAKGSKPQNPKTQRLRNKTSYDPEKVAQQLEAHIKALHEKLKITAEQELEWSVVAQAMRDNEAIVGSLMQEREEKAKDVNIIEDLEVYQKIARERANGLENLAAAFRNLYESMSAEQKQNADKVLGASEDLVRHSVRVN